MNVVSLLPYLAFSKWCRCWGILRLAVWFISRKGFNIYHPFLPFSISYKLFGTFEWVFVCNEFWFGRRKFCFCDDIIFHYFVVGWVCTTGYDIYADHFFHISIFPHFCIFPFGIQGWGVLWSVDLLGLGNICQPSLQSIALTRKLGIWIVRNKSGQKALFILLSSRGRQNCPEYVEFIKPSWTRLQNSAEKCPPNEHRTFQIRVTTKFKFEHIFT